MSYLGIKSEIAPAACRRSERRDYIKKVPTRGFYEVEELLLDAKIFYIIINI